MFLFQCQVQSLGKGVIPVFTLPSHNNPRKKYGLQLQQLEGPQATKTPLHPLVYHQFGAHPLITTVGYVPFFCSLNQHFRTTIFTLETTMFAVSTTNFTGYINCTFWLVKSHFSLLKSPRSLGSIPILHDLNTTTDDSCWSRLHISCS